MRACGTRPRISGVKCKSRRRRRDRARLAPRVNRLITLAIAAFVLATEVRWQRQMADRLQIGGRGKFDDALAFRQNRGDAPANTANHNVAIDPRATTRFHPGKSSAPASDVSSTSSSSFGSSVRTRAGMTRASFTTQRSPARK